jgi:hypothetical protein
LANELVPLASYVTSRLTGDGALAAIVAARCFADLAPEVDPATGLAPVYPLLIWHLQAVRDINALGMNRVMTLPLLCVKVVGQDTGYAGIQAAADRVDARLHKAPGQSVTFGGATITVAGAYREQPLMYSKPEDGVLYSYLGGIYRFIVY